MCKYCNGDLYLFTEMSSEYDSLNSDEKVIHLEGSKMYIYLSKSHYDSNKLDFDGDYGVFVEDYNIHLNIDIKYCPMCGARLIK